MEIILVLLVSLTASVIGSITGVGGGILMKPLLDLFGIMSVSAVSFLSGCTVLTMSGVSLLRSRNNGVVLQLKISLMLAVGAMSGGVIGNVLFEQVKTMFSSENVVGLIQSSMLLLITILVLFYSNIKQKLRSYNFKNFASSISVGFVLGVISSFLGIGGGPMNLAILFLFFSMDAKTAAKNSLFIIFFSQISNLLITVASNNIPELNIYFLIFMVVGGVVGALIGSKLTFILSNKQTEIAFQILLIIISGICIYNMINFSSPIIA